MFKKESGCLRISLRSRCTLKDHIPQKGSFWQTKINEHFSFQVEECVHLPVHAFKEQLACVRVFTEASQTHRNCIKLTYSTHQNDYASAVYELDASSIVWNEIQQVSSHNIQATKPSFISSD